MMHPLSEKIKKELLPFVMKPGRYIGNEFGAIKKDHQGKLKVVLAFPDVYEIGMSYLGLSILYHLINKRSNCVAERVFSPWVDAEELLRKENIPLFSLETHTPLKEFDVIGFSLTYELNYATVLNILDLAGIPVFSSQRTEDDPLVIAGGPSALNPEPMAEFIDLFALGDGEEIISEILDEIEKGEQNGIKKEELLLKLSRIPGVYVPSLYEVKYDAEKRFERITPKFPDNPEKIKVRTLPELKSEYYPTAPIVPFLETTHDRLTIEIMRGCPMGCRFCEARIAYYPKRERLLEDILKQAEIGIANSGWDELSLLSLSTTDYSKLPELAKRLQDKFYSKRVSISLPSLRPDTFSLELAQLLTRIKKPGLTFAPEAGTSRLRNVIGKNLAEEDLFNTVKIAYSSGWNLIKLYFMIGLPTERKEDLDGIIYLLKKIISIGKQIGGGKKLNVTISPFTPKPHTPFQWEKQEDIDGLQKKMDYLKSGLRYRNLNLKFRDPKVSYLEGILGRGDRLLSAVIHSAWKKGARLDAWTEHFKYQIWKEAFYETEIDPSFYLQTRDLTQSLPWDHVDKGIRKEYLQKEKNRAYTLGEEFVSPKGKVKVGDMVEKKVVEKIIAQPEESDKSSSEAYGRKKKRKGASPALTVARSRVRLKWSKSGEVRFTSHLDVGRMIERAIRRSGIPIAYSEGFHPHQKVAFGPPLPLGFISDSEYLDIQHSQPYSDAVLYRLNQALPPGFEFLEAKPILGKSESLSWVINLALYEVELDHPEEEINAKIQSILSQKNLLVKRNSKQGPKEIDIRKHIRKLECQGQDSKSRVKMLLGLGAGGYARPREILIYGFGLEEKEVLSLLFKRSGLFVKIDSEILTPLDVV
ncbi:MAG: TIGR03960 family B12-binding radical SAM protein [candidate division Zixibacteria bacterium]|nr:TIGR03960 family B12-binding radical SAM protein [candidate division Zixibacteria bacterium]